MKPLSRSAGIAAALIAAFALATTAHAAPDPLKCQQEIVKDLSKYVQAKNKALQKCNEAVVKGKILGPCPDATAAGKITKADSKLRSGVSKKCGGSTKSCTDGDAISPASISWPATCPNFESGSCNNLIGNCNDISDCLICIGEAAVDQSISLSYDALLPSTPGTDLNKCQVAIGKNASKFLNAKNKALAKCEGGVLKATVIGPCPDALKAVPAINKAESKKIAGICKACGGTDKICGGTGPDLTPAQIGFAANCPSVTIPGGSSCAAAIMDLQDIVDCVDCVNEFKADCLDPLSIPSERTYPSECNPPTSPPCASTPNNTPTPCPTATPGVTCPTQVVTDADGQGVDLDTGFTGQSHDAHAPDGNRLTLTLSGCTNPDASTCGVCTTSGPITNPGGLAFNTQRCVLDTAITCTSNVDCGGSGPCSFFFGSPLPLSAGGVAVCVTNQITAPVTGTADIEAGTTATTIQLLSRVHTGPLTAIPCPQCNGGICSAGLHVGGPCVVNGSSPLFGDVSFDCPPLGGANVGNLPITLAYTTGTQTRTLTASNVNCRATGFNVAKCIGGSNNGASPCADDSECPGGVCQIPKCFCDTCNNLAATPCTSNGDCVSVGATICGGRRCIGGANAGTPCNLSSECPGGGCGIPGAQTKSNECDDAICVPTSTCVGGCNDFLNCTGAFSCVGGANDGNLCTVASECPGGSCNEQCPGGSCLSGNEGTCAAGPFEQFCIIETFRACLSNADCTVPGDSCTLGKYRDCFLDNGVISGSVAASGVPYPACGSVGSGTVGALFCVPPTSSGSVNNVSGLPGLGRVTLPYTATFN